jgi:AcrR family transcriptional regulator
MRKRRRQDPHRDARVEMYRGFVRDAAETVFAEHGFARASMAQIARESRVSIGTIYRIFPGRKAAIYRAIQEERGTEVLGRTRAIGEAAWRQREDLIDAMMAGMVALVEFFAEHPHYLRLVLREENSWAVSGKASTEQMAMWREGFDATVAGMRIGISKKVLVDDDPEAMARTWNAIQQAHLGYWLEEGMRATPGEVAARLERQFLRAFCGPEVAAARGVRATPRGPEKR